MAVTMSRGHSLTLDLYSTSSVLFCFDNMILPNFWIIMSPLLFSLPGQPLLLLNFLPLLTLLLMIQEIL
jgi:hypothetical protein